MYARNTTFQQNVCLYSKSDITFCKCVHADSCSGTYVGPIDLCTYTVPNARKKRLLHLTLAQMLWMKSFASVFANSLGHARGTKRLTYMKQFCGCPV